MRVAIVKYNAGNIHSVVNSLKRLGVEPLLTDDREELLRADRVVFPGQGEARTTMESLRKKGLDRVIPDLRCPVLGICIGMQLMCRHSEEGDTDCLGIFDADVRRFVPTQHDEKVPAMGWNEVLPYGDYFYFVHSYYVPICKHTIATSNYIHPFSAALQRDNFTAMQFHPEKSGAAGERLLEKFIGQ